MNRRSFLGALAKGVAAFTILPSAGRVWKATRPDVWTPGHADLYAKLPYYLAKEQFESPHFRYLPSFQDFLNSKRERGTLTFDEILNIRDDVLDQLGEVKTWPPNMGDVTREVIKYDKPRSLDVLLPRFRV